MFLSITHHSKSTRRLKYLTFTWSHDHWALPPSLALIQQIGLSCSLLKSLLTHPSPCVIIFFMDLDISTLPWWLQVVWCFYAQVNWLYMSYCSYYVTVEPIWFLLEGIESLLISSYLLAFIASQLKHSFHSHKLSAFVALCWPLFTYLGFCHLILAIIVAFWLLEPYLGCFYDVYCLILMIILVVLHVLWESMASTPLFDRAIRFFYYWFVSWIWSS